MRIAYCITIILFTAVLAQARTLEVGPGKPITRLQTAAALAQSGDTILMRDGIYTGSDFTADLQGTASAWITIRAAEGESIIFRGGSQAFHLTDPAYLRIEGLTFEQQTTNGVNIDDAGTFETPAHHIIIENCEWRSMNATGNNDELKLSGLDDFTIRRCRFLNGATGGSLVDMVGCHRGLFEENLFENGGSNCIQAKGGTSDITIQRNRFLKGGERSINIGGSTDLQFFRPQGIHYEASSIFVYSNIFVGATAPIAYVGAVNCEVVNNTFIRPTRWAIRILQETLDEEFLTCGHNIFRNNIIVLGMTGQPAINIGPNTAPETFVFSNNLWYNPDNASWSGPNTPVTETDGLLNVDPQFSDTLYRLQAASPAIGKGYAVQLPERDFFGKLFAAKRAIGAVEAEMPSGVEEQASLPVSGAVAPNPVHDEMIIHTGYHHAMVKVVDISGSLIWQARIDGEARIDTHSWAVGIYIVQWGNQSYTLIKK